MLDCWIVRYGKKTPISKRASRQGIGMGFGIQVFPLKPEGCSIVLMCACKLGRSLLREKAPAAYTASPASPRSFGDDSRSTVVHDST